MVLQSKNDHVVPLGVAVLLLCLMEWVPHVEAHFTFELDLQLSTTTGSCDTIDFTPGCETYFRFCLRASTNGQSRNIDDCPLGSHGRVNENNVPSTVSISSNSAWPGSFQLYIKALDDDSPLPHEDLDFIFINSMWQPHQGYSSTATVTGDNRRVTVTLRYRVQCQDGYYGQDCNSVCGANEQCYSNGTVECVSGWQSPNTGCNTPICRTGCHPIGGNCSVPFQCECIEGWRGDLCDECIPAAGCSEVGGFCEVPGQCLCREGFGPPGACNEPTSRPPNVCVSSPCANGATCTPDSDSGSYTCHCPPGYTGPTCDTNVDECMAASCPVNSTCEDGVNTFRCVCNAGYEGPNCTETARNGQDVQAPSSGVIAGIIVGCLVVVLCILSVFMILLLFLVIRKRRHNKLTNSASPSESANFYSNAADSNSPKSYELTAVATTPTSEDSNHLETLVTNPLYGNPNNPPQLSDSTAISTSVSQTPPSPSTLHKLDNPLYGDPTENPLYGDPTERPTDIYSEPTAMQTGGTQNVNQYDYVTTAGDTSPSSTIPYHSYHTLQHIKETPPPVRMSKREGAGYEALQN